MEGQNNWNGLKSGGFLEHKQFYHRFYKEEFDRLNKIEIFNL